MAEQRQVLVEKYTHLKRKLKEIQQHYDNAVKSQCTQDKLVKQLATQRQELANQTTHLEIELAYAELVVDVDEQPQDIFLVCRGARYTHLSGKSRRYDPVANCPIIGVYQEFRHARKCFLDRAKHFHPKKNSPREFKPNTDMLGGVYREVMMSADYDDAYGGSDCVSIIQIRPETL